MQISPVPNGNAIMVFKLFSRQSLIGTGHWGFVPVAKEIIEHLEEREGRALVWACTSFYINPLPIPPP